MQEKPFFEVKMQHNEDTLVALAHMQYDLFCTRNRVARSFLSVILILIALLYGGGNWWSLLIIAYACYLTTTTYASSNHTAHKLAEQLKASKMPFPSSRYLFGKDAMQIITLPDGEQLDPLPYSQVLQLGEDFKAYYLFRDQYGGYRIPKEELGEQEEEFRKFVQGKTGKKFIRRLTPLRRLRMWLDHRANEPEHL